MNWKHSAIASGASLAARAALIRFVTAVVVAFIARAPSGIDALGAPKVLHELLEIDVVLGEPAEEAERARPERSSPRRGALPKVTRPLLIEYVEGST